MALSEAQQHLVFEVLGIPNDTSVLYIDGKWGTGSSFQTGAILVTRDEVIAKLVALDDAPEARLAALLLEWERVSTAGVKLKPVGTNQGVDRDPRRERRLIRARVKVIVPVYLKAHEADTDGSLSLG